MKQNLITDVIQGMLPYLNNAQTERLQEVLQHTLFDYEVTKTEKDKELSLYDTGVSAEYGDKLISLSTCEYSRNNGRLVVVAKRVD